jgi:uncharacterized protein YjbI with pentapeptide repeats
VAASPGPRPPALRPLRLPDLDDAESSDIGPARSLSALRVTPTAAQGRSLSEARCSEALFVGGFDDVDCRAARFLETRFDQVAAVRLLATGSTWRASQLQHCRIGAVELDGAVLGSVALAQSKLDRLNLAGAQLSDVLVQGCRIGECDLSRVDADRVAFAETQIGTLTVTGAQLRDVDLRSAQIERIHGVGDLGGATITEEQLAGLAPALAEQLSIHVAAAR